MKSIRQIITATAILLALGAPGDSAEAGSRKQIASKPARAPISTRATTLIGAKLKQRVKATGHQSGRLKLNQSEIAGISDAELAAAEPEFARAGIKLSNRTTVVHVDGSGPTQATWYFRALNQRAKPGAVKPSGKTLRRIGRPKAAATYAEIKTFIAEQGQASGELFYHVGNDAELGMDTMTYIEDQVAPLLRNDNIRIFTTLIEAGSKAVRVRYQLTTP
ncbi:MAG: hypothetical protein IPL79_18990 [Myxococcales bacterium]|nr:hypothetical protein [Myxococcales bacterium]